MESRNEWTWQINFYQMPDRESKKNSRMKFISMAINSLKKIDLNFLLLSCRM